MDTGTYSLMIGSFLHRRVSQQNRISVHDWRTAASFVAVMDLTVLKIMAVVLDY